MNFNFSLKSFIKSVLRTISTYVLYFLLFLIMFLLLSNAITLLMNIGCCFLDLNDKLGSLRFYTYGAFYKDIAEGFSPISRLAAILLAFPAALVTTVIAIKDKKFKRISKIKLLTVLFLILAGLGLRSLNGAIFKYVENKLPTGTKETRNLPYYAGPEEVEAVVKINPDITVLYQKLGKAHSYRNCPKNKEYTHDNSISGRLEAMWREAEDMADCMENNKDVLSNFEKIMAKEPEALGSSEYSYMYETAAALEADRTDILNTCISLYPNDTMCGGDLLNYYEKKHDLKGMWENKESYPLAGSLIFQTMLTQSGNFEKALEFNDILDAKFKNGEPPLDLGKAKIFFWSRLNDRIIIELVNRTINRNIRQLKPDISKYRAQIYFRQGEYDKALEALNNAAKPDESLYAKIYAGKGEYDKAYSYVKGKNMDDFRALSAFIYAKYKEGKADEVLNNKELLNEFKEERQKLRNMEGSVIIAQMYFDKKDYKKALEMLAPNANRGSYWTYIDRWQLLEKVYTKLGRKKDADRARNQAGSLAL